MHVIVGIFASYQVFCVSTCVGSCLLMSGRVCAVWVCVYILGLQLLLIDMHGVRNLI